MNNIEKIYSQLDDVFLVIRVIGNGEKNIMAFHGYGQTGKVYERFATHHPEYTVYAFDLFYHGQSAEPNPEKPLAHSSFYELFDQLLQRKNIDRFELMGFSMGGKYVLSIACQYYERIDGIHLIAPDGVRVNFWYFLATRYKLGRIVFKYVVYHPQLIFGLIRSINQFGILNKMVTKFALNEMDSFEKRKRVYNSWVYLRKFFIDKKTLVSKLERLDIPVYITLGKHDRVIKYADVHPFVKLLKNKQVDIIDTGHTHLLYKYFDGDYLP